MPRHKRSYLPGAVFHLTARTQGREPWFTEALRSPIVACVASTIRVSDARLLAYAIMPNHLHLVIIQGECSLGRVMQPLLRRVAFLVQRAHQTEGHVFERRFRERACLDPGYVRNAILYTHLNPVRAGLAGDPATYHWTSHGLYATEEERPSCMIGVLAADHALSLFAPRERLELPALRRAYREHVGWRVRCDLHEMAEALGKANGPAPGPPSVLSGDMYWARAFAVPFRPSAQRSGREGLVRAPRTDLREIAVRTLAEQAPGLELERVRSGDKGRAVVRIRRIMVPRMSAAGHRGGAIARFLRVSDQCVSNILVAERRGRGRDGERR